MLLPWEDLLPESLTIFSFLSEGSKCLIDSLGLLPLDDLEPCSPSLLLWLLCFLPLRSLRLPEALIFVRFFSYLEILPAVDERGLLELDFEDLGFFFSPSFLILDLGFACNICGGKARMLLAGVEEASSGTEVAGDDSIVEATTGAVVDGGGPEAGPDDRGGTDDTQFCEDDAAPLPGSNAGCAAVVPFSRTSQFLTSCNVFDEAVNMCVATASTA